MPSADGIAAVFPHTILKKVNGTPSRINKDNVQEKQTKNAASRPSTRGGRDAAFSVYFSCASSMSIWLGVPLIFSKILCGNAAAIPSAGGIPPP